MVSSWLRTFAKRLTRRPLRKKTPLSSPRFICSSKPAVESLEGRDLPSVTFHPDYVVLSTLAKSDNSQGIMGYTPAEIREAYGFNQVSETGAGETIAIVDAYSDPTITSDLHAFDQEFGLADPTLTIVNQTGGSTLPAANTGWAGEISLDVEWAHAIAPGAKIMLVEATSATDTNLFAAVKYAAAQKGVAVVSMSWGGSEFSGETSLDSTFSPPSSNPDVAFVNSAGDSGAPAQYPSTSPDVLSVGGTSLNLSSSGSYLSESAWDDGGGGISQYESQPSFQKGIVTQSTTKRTSPDVAYDADPNTGFAVYETYGNSSGSAWQEYGGTSAGSPQWSALIALADQGRAADGESALSSSTLLKDIYSLPAADLHDVTTGSNNEYSAGTGYDLITGRGSPVANLVINSLIGGSTTTTTATHLSVTGPATATAGDSFTITVTALNASDQAVTNYTGTISFTSSDGQAVLPGSYTFTTSNKGTATFTVTLKTAGSESITATDAADGISGSDASILVSPGAVTSIAFVQQPTSTSVGSTISPAVTVEELDAYGNVVTTDSTSTISLALGSNPGSATLSGGQAVTVTEGIATFSGLSVSVAGSGYTLVATDGSLTATSAAFTISSGSTGGSNVIENFQNGLGEYYYMGNSYPYVETTPAAAHPGTATEGLLDEGDGNWYFREDSGAVVSPGETISAWVEFAGKATGRAYVGFGTTSQGLDSVVLAPNTDQLLIQNNAGFFTFTNLAAANQTYKANTWYLVQVEWGTTGTVTANLYASNGTTLLKSVTANTGDTTPGTFALRAYDANTYFSTVTETGGSDSSNFVVGTGSGAGNSTNSGGSQSGASGGSSGRSGSSFWWMSQSPPVGTSEAAPPPYFLWQPSASEAAAFGEWGVWVG